MLDSSLIDFSALTEVERLGDITKFTGLLIEATGPANAAIGEICQIISPNNEVIMQAEVIGFEACRVFLMPHGHIHGISMGCKVRALAKNVKIAIGKQHLGRIIDAFAKPIDKLGALSGSDYAYCSQRVANPLDKEPITKVFETKVQCIDSLLTLGFGQRLGIFAGSGVGKSVLLGMIANQSVADVNVIALIGERGREVNEFLQHNLGAEGLAKSIVVVATADEPALVRKQAVYTATAIAQYFCQQGSNVLLLMDSITRFAMAQREISLALGEPPTARGYTPSVFSLLPGIVERAGNFKQQGSITAFYSVLVEGDDFNEPIADTMRSLLDGHIVLTRQLAHKSHYPAIDVLQSISRLASQLLSDSEESLRKKIIELIHCYEKSRDLIEVGAYQQGVNAQLDTAIGCIDKINALLRQVPGQSLSRSEVIEQLQQIITGVNDE